MKTLGYLFLLLLAGCSLTDPEFPMGANRREPPHSSHSATPEEEPEKHLWVSAVSYPAIYDWKRDTARGTVACRIVLLKDGKPACEVPVAEGRASPDPDKHRILGGHLYTDAPDGTETVISRDGKELFRYPGREALRGFWVGDDETVHSLGQHLDAGGFTYRINGQETFTRNSGTVFGEIGSGTGRSGALYPDGDDICFAFETPGRHYAVFRGGMTEDVMLQDPQKVFDIRCVGGQVISAYLDKDGHFRIGVDEKEYAPAPLGVIAARILSDGTGAWLVAVSYQESSGPQRNALLSEKGVVKYIVAYNGMLDYTLLGEEAAYVASDTDGRVAAMYWNGRTVDFGLMEKWQLISPACIWMNDSDWWLALTAEPGKPPQIRHGNEKTTVLINGYLTGIAYE